MKCVEPKFWNSVKMLMGNSICPPIQYLLTDEA
jgi:hypothetical protein